jgi:hypothetical protein
MKQVQQNPTVNEDLTIATYSFSATGASGTVTGTGVDALERGQSIILGLSGSSAEGYTKNEEYFVIPVDTTHFKIASSYSNALKGTYLSSASGNAGGGTIYPNYRVGGTLFVGTGGDINLRGIGVSKTGLTSFSLHKNVSDGSQIPNMIGAVCASGTTATDLIIWSN